MKEFSPRQQMPERDVELNRESWRVLRIMTEFVEGFEQLSRVCPAISIFGSARTAQDHPWFIKAEKISRLLSDSGFSVISGGGPGIMEAANRGAFAGPSPSIGLNIALPHEQTSNRYQDVSLSYRHFFARKVMFIKYAAAYVVLPGGFGTLDELAECLTLIQTGKSRRIPIILVEADYWSGLLNWFRDSLCEAGTIDPTDLDMMQVIDEPEDIVKAIFDHYETRGFEPSAQEREILLEL